MTQERWTEKCAEHVSSWNWWTMLCVCAADPGMWSAVLRHDGGRERASASDIRQTLANETQAHEVPQHRLPSQTTRLRYSLAAGVIDTDTRRCAFILNLTLNPIIRLTEHKIYKWQSCRIQENSIDLCEKLTTNQGPPVYANIEQNVTNPTQFNQIQPPIPTNVWALKLWLTEHS